MAGWRYHRFLRRDHLRAHARSSQAARAAIVTEAEYELPYLAHAPIEPINCTARVADGRCEIWVPTQSQTLAQCAAAKAAGVRASFTMLRGGLDSRGRPTAWFHRIVGPELAHWDIEIPYRIPNLRVECVEHDPGIPTGYWRSVGAAQNAYPIESFIDELSACRRPGPGAVPI